MNKNVRITVMSRSKATRLFRGMFSFEKESVACIAIKGFHDEIIQRSFYPYLTLSLTFDDVDIEDRVKGEFPITDSQARQIACFAKSLPEGINSLIVHCEAGVSRSAGVAAAIMKWMFNDDSQIFDQPAYNPNMMCYRKVLNYLMDESTNPLTEELATQLLMKFVSNNPHGHGDYKGFKILEKEYESTSPRSKMIVFKCNYTWMLHGWDKNTTQSFGVIMDYAMNNYTVSPGLVERYRVDP